MSAGGLELGSIPGQQSSIVVPITDKSFAGTIGSFAITNVPKTAHRVAISWRLTSFIPGSAVTLWITGDKTGYEYWRYVLPAGRQSLIDFLFLLPEIDPTYTLNISGNISNQQWEVELVGIPDSPLTQIQQPQPQGVTKPVITQDTIPMPNGWSSITIGLSSTLTVLAAQAFDYYLYAIHGYNDAAVFPMDVLLGGGIFHHFSSTQSSPLVFSKGFKVPAGSAIQAVTGPSGSGANRVSVFYGFP